MPMRGRSCLSIRARRPERLSSIRANAISTSSSRTIGPSAMASASGASVSNGRASSGCPRNKSGQTGAPHRKWSDGSPICPRFMAGGPGEPLGARALYLGPLRLPHPRNQPAGDDRARAVSSGCFRLDNADVIDLYDRTSRSAQKSSSKAVGPRFLMRRRGLKVGGLCGLGEWAGPHRLEGTPRRSVPHPVDPPQRGWSSRDLAAVASAQRTSKRPE